MTMTTGEIEQTIAEFDRYAAEAFQDGDQQRANRWDDRVKDLKRLLEVTKERDSLRTSLKIAHSAVTNIGDEMDAAKLQRDRYKTALEQYGDAENWGFEWDVAAQVYVAKRWREGPGNVIAHIALAED